ncbi:4-fold beta flower protein [uncultured Winogradskyella sp.]|uniref:4-fold beta flower protein n=1 Tax=uncultured Winogradskyella sp. TaxID=395353 RepID=UPI0034CD92DE
MVPIFDSNGFTVAWLSGDDIYDRKGIFLGYIDKQTVYDTTSNYCGTLRKSFFRDIKGYVVAFLKDAKNGPVLPVLKPLPTKPIRKSKSIIKPKSPIPPPKSVKSQWSKLGWHDFIKCS